MARNYFKKKSGGEKNQTSQQTNQQQTATTTPLKLPKRAKGNIIQANKGLTFISWEVELSAEGKQSRKASTSLSNAVKWYLHTRK